MITSYKRTISALYIISRKIIVIRNRRIIIVSLCMIKSVHPSEPMMHTAYSLSIFTKFTNSFLFSLNLLCLTSPYFDRDSFMHHALHALDAPAYDEVESCEK